MSPGSPGGATGPRRIDWNRLPGPGGPGSPPPPPAEPRRPGGLPQGPVAGGPAAGPGGTDRPTASAATSTRPRTSAAPRAPPARATAWRPNASGSTAAVERASGAHDQVDAEPPQRPEHKGAKGTESRLSQPHKRQYLSLWVELPLLLVVAFSAAVLLRTFAVQPFYIPSGSMEQTLQEGDKVLVLKLTTTLRTPQRGEVVVFRGTDSWDPEYRPATGDDTMFSTFTTGVLDLIGLAKPDEKDFIKRVIAVGGDTVSCCDADGNVVVNGVSLHEEAYSVRELAAGDRAGHLRRAALRRSGRPRRRGVGHGGPPRQLLGLPVLGHGARGEHHRPRHSPGLAHRPRHRTRDPRLLRRARRHHWCHWRRRRARGGGHHGRRRPGRVEHRLAPAAFLAHHGNAKSRFAGHVEGGHPWGQGASA